jgi:hypothetical protein
MALSYNHLSIWGRDSRNPSGPSLTDIHFQQRPFLYFYAPVFLLYEASTPFLNIHWFCDKLNLTGSTIQAVNGVFLIATFFGCRIIWGLYSSVAVFADIYTAIAAGHSVHQSGILGEVREVRKDWASGDVGLYWQAHEQETAVMGEKYLPLWLALTYLASNLVLNLLNLFWFGKMIETIRKRFDPPFGTKGAGPDVKHWEPQEKVKVNKPATSVNGDILKVEGTPEVSRSLYADGHTGVEVSGTVRRSGRSRRKA